MQVGDQGSWPPPGTRLRLSHTSILVNAYDPRLARSPDAIIVPSYRPAAQIKHAGQLAQAMCCPLLVLSSQRSVASEVAQVMGLEGADGIAATVLPGNVKGWLRLKSLSWTPERPRSYVDRSVKRNVGLLVAKMMRWTRVLFVDDDITNLAPDVVRRAVPHVGWRGPRVAGWRALHYPDNSVACHALRSVEIQQGVFIAGSALLVHVPGRLPFFPATYNEDWLFMHNFLGRGKVGWVADVNQDHYSPFEDPSRASGEEFGDVLAEGLMALVHERRSVLVACLPSYWHDVIGERQGMLRFIEERLWRLRDAGHNRTHDGHDLTQVLRSVQVSRDALDRTTPEDLAEFTSAWRHDIYLWNSRLHRLPKFTQIEDALNFLEITDFYRPSVIPAARVPPAGAP